MRCNFAFLAGLLSLAACGDKPEEKVVTQIPPPLEVKAEVTPPPAAAKEAPSVTLEDALALFHGEGSPGGPDREGALELFRKIAKDSPIAEFYIGECLREKATGDLPLEAQMYEHYHRAATGGLPEAAFRVGNCLVSGKGVPQDDVQAVNWFRKAAEEGLVPAQVAVAEAYHLGIGAPQSDLLALSWLYLAGAFNAGGLDGEEKLKSTALTIKTEATKDTDAVRRAINIAPSLVNYTVIPKT